MIQYNSIFAAKLGLFECKVWDAVAVSFQKIKFSLAVLYFIDILHYSYFMLFIFSFCDDQIKVV